MSDPFVGQILNGYRIDRRRGGGAFSWVYEATHLAKKTVVAVKLLQPNAGLEQIREFDNEGDLLVALSGAEHVVNILDTQVSRLDATLPGTSASLVLDARFHVLELADGCLDTVIANLPMIPWTERLGLFRDAVHGVHQMHRHSMAHRDLKSANCLLFESGGSSVVVKVGDLGRARDLTKAAMASDIHYRVGRGDPAFRPPECLWNLGRDDQLAHRSADLYGTGSLLFEFITGHGLTGVALLPQRPIVEADRLLSEDKRLIRYIGRHDEIRAWINAALGLAEPSIPAPIRNQTLQLIRQLCDPDPLQRFPHVVGTKRKRIPTDLHWLLRRTDILMKSLVNSENPKFRGKHKKATA